MKYFFYKIALQDGVNLHDVLNERNVNKFLVIQPYHLVIQI